MLTLRSFSAARARASAPCGSRRYAAAVTARVSWRFPSRASATRSPATSASTASRSAADSQVVSRAMMPARHSEIAPAVRAARVHGRSVSRSVANVSWARPCHGESRRASPTCSPTPGNRSCAARHDSNPWPLAACRAACAARSWDAANVTVTRACAAATAAFTRSSLRSTASRSRSLGPSPPTSASESTSATRAGPSNARREGSAAEGMGPTVSNRRMICQVVGRRDSPAPSTKR